MKIRTIGIDLAKTVFQIHGVDRHGKVVARKTLKRSQMLEYFAKLEPCLIGMEACGGAHYWARTLRGYGHTVKLMAPQFVKPYVKTNKNDRMDAEAICEAVGRPTMRFVPIKSEAQQAILALHRARSGFIKARTAQANQLRGLLSEFGRVLPGGIGTLRRRMPELVADEGEQGLPGALRPLLARLWEHLKTLDRQIASLEHEIQTWHRQHEASRRLEAIPGLGPLTASAVVATVGDGRAFSNGRQLAAWLGLVPRQHSSGGKQTLRGISKRGDTYLRTLLIHGARAVLRQAEKQGAQTWLHQLMTRRNKNIAAVALANKNARTLWALLAHQRTYQPEYAGIQGA